MPDGMAVVELRRAHPKTRAEWAALGVTNEGGDTLPAGTPLWLVRPEGSADGYLVTENYRRLMEWNRSVYFATSVGLLSNAIGKNQRGI